MSQPLLPLGGRTHEGARPAPLRLLVRQLLWAAPFLGLLLATACTYDSAEDLVVRPPSGPACDSTAVTFSGQVMPLLQQQCGGCHNNTVRRGNVSLATHAQVQQVAANGRLLGTVLHAPGYAPMPANQPRLPACDLARLRQWVRAGAPNN